MERAFTVSENHNLFLKQRSYETNLKKQKEFVKRFCEENGIESGKYYIGGDGSVNVSFLESHKKNITFGIIPTENDKQKFASQLRVPNEHGVSHFKKSSQIAKLFAELCIKEEIVVNIWKPMIRDYFKSLSYARFQSRCFEYNGKVYVSVSSEKLNKDELPDGFEEIKMSELYRVIEEIEAKEGR